MPSTYSTNLRLELIADGEQSGTWGQTANRNLGTLLEAAISGVQTVTLTTTTYTLSANNGVADEARNAALVFSGTLTGNCTVTAPSVKKNYIVKNATTGGFDVLLKTSGGTAYTIKNGETVFVFCDALDFFLVGVSTVSPAFTGTPTSPTAAPSTNTTQIATTAFVQTSATSTLAAATAADATRLPAGVIVMWSGSIASIPAGWYLCNGSNGTPDLRDRFVVGAGTTYAVAGTGGSKDAIVVSHSHTTSSDGSHTHTTTGQVSGFFNYSGGGGSAGVGTPLQANGTTSTAGAHTHTISTVGSSGTNANLPPYYALAYIMKA